MRAASNTRGRITQNDDKSVTDKKQVWNDMNALVAQDRIFYAKIVALGLSLKLESNCGHPIQDNSKFNLEFAFSRQPQRRFE